MIAEYIHNQLQYAFQPTKGIFFTELQVTVPSSNIQVKWNQDLTVQVYLEYARFFKKRRDLGAFCL